MSDGRVGPYGNENHWEIDLDTFLQRLLEEWPTAKIRYREKVNSILISFELPMGSDEWGVRFLHGDFTGQDIFLNGRSRFFVPVAIRYRKIVPSEHKIYLGYDDFFSNAVEVKEGMTVEELEEMVGLI